MPLDNVVFWVFAPDRGGQRHRDAAVRNAVHAALLLIVNFFCLAVLFLMLGAPFLFAVQIIVYAGAIMVLFLFVIMLLGVDRGEDLTERLIGTAAGSPSRSALGVVARDHRRRARGRGVRDEGAGGLRRRERRAATCRRWREVLFTQYFFPFEVTSVLLIVAAIARDGAGTAPVARRHAGRDRRRHRPRGGLRAPRSSDEDADRVLPGALGDAVHGRHGRRADPAERPDRSSCRSSCS